MNEKVRSILQSGKCSHCVIEALKTEAKRRRTTLVVQNTATGNRKGVKFGNCRYPIVTFLNIADRCICTSVSPTTVHQTVRA